MAGNNKTIPRNVVDASYMLSFLLSEGAEEIDRTYQRFIQGGIRLASSNLLVMEVGNGLRSAVLRKRITADTAKSLLTSFLALGIEYEEPDPKEVLKNALNFNTTYYDSVYLTMAREKGCRLLSLDRDLVSLAG